MTSPRARAAWITLAVIVALGAGLRVWAIRYGLPAVYNPDEIPILNRALALGENRLNPHNFLYPSLYFYALFVWEGLFFVVGRLAGWYASLRAFEDAFFVDVSPFIVAGRLLTALFGTATIVAAYRFATRLYDRATGLVAALLLAAAPFAVRDAHYIKHDVPVTLFVTLTLGALAVIVSDPVRGRQRRSWIIAGLLSGFAMSTHYYAFPIVVPIIGIAILDAPRLGGARAAWWLLVTAGVASVAGFFIGTPFLAIEPATAVRDMVAVRQIDVDRAVVGAHAFASLDRYLVMLWRDAIGWPVCLFAIAGSIWAWRADRHRAWLLTSFPIAFLAFLANTVPMNRYVNAMLPSMAVAAAFAIVELCRRAGSRAVPATIALALLAAIPGIAGSVQSDRFFLQDDTRTLASRYIESTIPADATILIQPYTVSLRRSRASLIDALRENLGSEAAASIKFQRQLNAPVAAPAYRTLFLGDGGSDADKIYVPLHPSSGGVPADLKARDVEYVVVKRYNTPNPALDAWQTALARDAHLMATFSPYRSNVSADERAQVAPFLHNTDARIDAVLDRPGPVLEIWRVTLR